ncbi:hypothetical protein [Amnibacterium endophyticum]|uniref:DNA modification methylase n=1 Tax=Amnibacterium endophyticum TaxID=2109337 RepID=A0ABW4LG20_9MICO
MRLRFAATAAVTALVAGALSGCMFVTPQQTVRTYTPSDGINGQVGDVQIRNVLLLSSEGDVATMLGVLSNTGDSPASVTLRYSTATGTETTRVSVPANGVLSLRPNVDAQAETQVTTRARSVRLTDVDLTPGALFPVGFSTGSADPVSLQVPVLDGSLPEYQPLVPTPSASVGGLPVGESPSPSESSTAEPTPSPSAGEG